MASGALSSDHVNYLILRYLQEAGHENAATAFYRDWHRLPEFRNPENYPFAPVVRRGELVNVIQDGLHHDELIARVKKNDRRFQFTNINTREVLERRDGAVFENGVVGSRPSSSAKRKGRPLTMRPPDEFPTPAPKRQRRSEGSENLHLNGDAMEVDAASASADADEDGDAVSPAVSAEPDMVEVPERYDSMDVAVQTEVKTGPKTSTMYWKVDKPGATIYHCAFNPASDSKDGTTLLTVGESLCRYYQVPHDIENLRQILSVDEPSLPPNSDVTASAWHPQGHTAIHAIDSIRELPDGRQEQHQMLLSHNRDTGSSSNYLFPPLLDPAGIVLALRYSSNGRYLLVARTNLKRGLVLVYDTSESDESNHEPIAWRIFEDPVFDVAWKGDAQFMVCGERSLLGSFELSPRDSMQNSALDFTDQTIRQFGLEHAQFTTFDWPSCKWDKIRHDIRTNTTALASAEDGKLAVGMPAPGQPENRFWGQTDVPGQLTALAFQSDPTLREHENPLIAIACEEGLCKLYTNSVKDFEPVQIIDLVTFYLSEGPALALSWSPGGDYLAVGGTELVQIWETETLVHRDREGRTLERREDSLYQPLVTWRPDRTATATPRNGEHLKDKPLTEPSLSWSADRENLSFAIDRQVAIIRFRPPLGEKRQAENGDPNGHHSP